MKLGDEDPFTVSFPALSRVTFYVHKHVDLDNKISRRSLRRQRET